MIYRVSCILCMLLFSTSAMAGTLSVVESSPDSKGAQETAAPTVELYTTSWCGYCQKARMFFRERGIKFIEYDIEKDPKAAYRKRQLDSGRGVPFAIINGQKISGYSAAVYTQALKRTP